MLPAGHLVISSSHTKYALDDTPSQVLVSILLGGDASRVSSTRIRGAHRRPQPAADPVVVVGPRRWVVSAGVLAVVAGISGVGVYALQGGGGDGSAAAVSRADTQPTPWTAQSFAVTSPLGSTAGPGDDVTAPDGEAASGDAAAASDGPEGPASPPPRTSAPARTPSPAVPADSRLAGIATTTLVQAGTGRLRVVPGVDPAPNWRAPKLRVRVEVEGGIGADGPAFAAFVMSTLNDRRSWAHPGTLSFERTDGPADFRVILASPATAARLCAPAAARGTASCGGGDKAVLTMYRWLSGIPDYAGDRTAYRHYLINHEVGHVLGHGHVYCTPGRLAPVMMQQTTGLHGCRPNAWPFP